MIDLSGLNSEVRRRRRADPVTASLQELAVAFLESFGDSEGHPFHGNQWTGGRGGEEPSGAKYDKKVKDVAPREGFEKRFIHEALVPRDQSKLAAKVDQLVSTLPADPNEWFQPAPATTQAQMAVQQARIDDLWPRGTIENKYATALLGNTVASIQSGKGYGYGPTIDMTVFTEGDGERISNTDVDQIRTMLAPALLDMRATTYVPTPEEKLFKAEHDVNMTWPKDENGDQQPRVKDALEYAQWRYQNEIDPDNAGPPPNASFGRVTVDQAFLDPAVVQPPASTLTDRMTQTEGVMREVGQAVSDRADEIITERGGLPKEQLELAHAANDIALSAARADVTALNKEFAPNGTGGDLSQPYSFTKDGEPKYLPLWTNLTPEQQVEYKTRLEDIGYTNAKLEYDGTRQALKEVDLDRREAVFAALREVRDLGPGDTGGVKLHREDFDAPVVRAAERYIPTDWIRKSNEGTALDVRMVDGRGFYRSFGQTKYGGSDLRYNDRTSDFGEISVPVMAHELMHRMEEQVPGVREAEFAQYARRTAGEPLQRLGSGYRADERTRADEWFDAYVGKEYGGTNKASREMLSMGIDSLVGRGYVGNLAKRDPELEQLVLGMLATIPGKKA